ncbi:hypothetical protein Tco_0408369 [Tanacetum coccineum]
MAEGEIDNLTIEQYLALTCGNHAPCMVKPEIGGNVNFKTKSQFMRELREDTFFENKNVDAYEHVERVLDIVSLFNIPGVSHDDVMLRVFPITLTRTTKRWVDRLPLRTVDSWESPLKGLYLKTMVEHSQKWHDGSSGRSIEGSSSEGITAIDAKPAKELTLIKTVLLTRKLREWKKLNIRISVDLSQTTDMTEASKRQAKQDEWLKKFYKSTEASRETYDKIIQDLEGKEIKYFSANLGFSDNEEQETNDSGMAEVVAALEATLKKKREEPKKVKLDVNYYVDPYEPLIPFPKRLEHHAEKALVHQTMESLKKIKRNSPLLKKIRQTDNYAKKMKYLVEYVGDFSVIRPFR